MVDSKGIKEKVSQVAVQAVTAVMIAFTDTETRLQQVITPN